jgi:heptosyltransferase-1
MHILVVKTTSLGDVLHTLPALTDAAACVPGIRFDWLVEPAYEPVCRWHPAVERTITVAYRRWRRSPMRSVGPAREFHNTLRSRHYDLVIDAQGLIKSAMFTALARGPRHGFNFRSAGEWPAALAYRHRHTIPRTVGAVDRLRRLFAAAIGYDVPATPANFGLRLDQFGPAILPGRYLVFNHGTAWPTKRWTVARWRELAALAGRNGYGVCLPWHDDEDRARADAIAAGLPAVSPMKLDIPGVARAVAGAAGAVGVETAFSHLAAALGLPTVTLYGPTGPRRHGTCGANATDLPAVDFPCSPCYGRTSCKLDPARSDSPPCLASLTAEQVWQTLMATAGAQPRHGAD